MIFGVSSELENLSFLGLEDIFSFEIRLNNGVKCLNLAT